MKSGKGVSRKKKHDHTKGNSPVHKGRVAGDFEKVRGGRMPRKGKAGDQLKSII